MTWIDWSVLLLYLVVITLIGLWTMKRVKSAAHFFISDRHAPAARYGASGLHRRRPAQPLPSRPPEPTMAGEDKGTGTASDA